MVLREVQRERLWRVVGCRWEMVEWVSRVPMGLGAVVLELVE